MGDGLGVFFQGLIQFRGHSRGAFLQRRGGETRVGGDQEGVTAADLVSQRELDPSEMGDARFDVEEVVIPGGGVVSEVAFDNGEDHAPFLQLEEGMAEFPEKLVADDLEDVEVAGVIDVVPHGDIAVGHADLVLEHGAKVPKMGVSEHPKAFGTAGAPARGNPLTSPMEPPKTGILVAEEKEVILLRVEGKGTHLTSHLFKRYVHQCLSENRRQFHVDLSQCSYMDSTFLGMMAGIGIKLKERSFPAMKLVNINDRVRGMFEALGIDHLFELVQRAATSGEFKEVEGYANNVEGKARDMLEAHEKLVEVSTSNEAKFRDVIALLREEVRKTGGA